MQTLGEYLHILRAKKGLSLSDVGKSTGITTTRLNRIEHDHTKEPSPHALMILAEFYDVSLIDLYIRAGYLKGDTLNTCPKIFTGVENLDDNDRNHIQQQIDYLIEKNV